MKFFVIVDRASGGVYRLKVEVEIHYYCYQYYNGHHYCCYYFYSKIYKKKILTVTIVILVVCAFCVYVSINFLTVTQHTTSEEHFRNKSCHTVSLIALIWRPSFPFSLSQTTPRFVFGWATRFRYTLQVLGSENYTLKMERIRYVVFSVCGSNTIIYRLYVFQPYGEAL